MDLEMMKTILVEMIREAENLPQNELERINNTNVSVKRGRVEEFKAYARLYVEVAHNVKIDDNIDYITIAFNDLKNEIKDEEDKFYAEKSQSFYEANYNNIEKFRQSQKSLEMITRNHANLQNRYQELQNNMQRRVLTSEQLKQFDSISSDIRDFLNGMGHVRETIGDLKKQINENFVVTATEQLERLRGDYANTANSVGAAYSSDGKSILASDKVEYDNILKLIELTKRVNSEQPLELVNDTICVNSSMVEEVKELLATSKLFSKLVKPEYSPLTLNTNLLASLDERIAAFRNAGEKISHTEALSGLPVGSLTTYEALIELRRILSEANNNYISKDKRTTKNGYYSEQYVGVWDAAFVHESLKERVEALFRKTGIVKKEDPNISKLATNEKLILALENHKKALEDITPLGQGNVLTSIASDGVTVVRDEFLEEYNAVIGALDILHAAENQYDLRDVWGIGNVRTDDIMAFKKYISKISILSKKVPGLSANELAIDSINEELTALNDKARTRKKADLAAILAPNGVVLHEDLPVYNALLEQLKFLELSKGQENLLEVDGAFVAPKYLASYKAAKDREEEAKALTPPVPTSGAPVPPPITGGGASPATSGAPVPPPTENNGPTITFDNNTLNAEIKADLKAQIEELFDLATGVPSEYLASTGVLKGNADFLKALMDIKDYLEHADNSPESELVQIELDDYSIKVHKDDEAKCKAALEACTNAQLDTFNRVKLDEINMQINILTSSAIGVNEGTQSHEAITIDGYKVLNVDKEKLDALLTLKNIIEKALNVNAEEELLNNYFKIDGLYIHKDDEEKYKQAVEILNKLENTVTANDKFLKEVIEKIHKLVGDAASSLDTNVVTIDGFTVLKTSENELKALLDVKDCLEHAKNADATMLKTIDGIKICLRDEMTYTKAMAVLNNTELLSVEANHKKVEEIEKSIEMLEENAYGLDVVKKTIINGYTVASKDEEKLQALLDMKEILARAIETPDSECKMVDGFKIRITDEQKYHNILDKLNDFTETKNKNEEKEAEVDARIAELEAKAASAPDTDTVVIEGHKVLAADEDEMNNLLDIKDCLTRAKTSDNLVKQKDGVMIAKDDAKLYKKVVKPKRQKVNVRKLGSKGLQVLKAHKKAAIIGLVASSLAFWGAAVLAPGAILAVPAAIKAFVLSNAGLTIGGTSIFGALIATKGRGNGKEFAQGLYDKVEGSQALTQTELAIGKIAHDTMKEYTGAVSEEKFDKLDGVPVEEQINSQMHHLDNIHQAISDRIKAINAVTEEERAKEREQDERVLTPYTIVSEEPVQTITIPSDEELIESISDKNLIMAQIDQYVDKVLNGEDGYIYSNPIFKLTGIDLFKYDVKDPAKVAQAKKDVDEALNKWDVSYILGQANNYFYADKKGLDTEQYRDIVAEVTDINLDDFKTTKKNQEILLEDIRKAMKRKHDSLMAQLIFAQAENYTIANKNNEDTTLMRDAVYGATGVDLNEYDFKSSSGMSQADGALTQVLKSSNEALIEDLKRKVADLQALIDAGVAPEADIKKAEDDKNMLISRIESLSNNSERGI